MNRNGTRAPGKWISVVSIGCAAFSLPRHPQRWAPNKLAVVLRSSCWLSAWVACGLLILGQPGSLPGENLFNRISSLRVLRQSADQTETLFVVNYEYDGRAGMAARLVPVISSGPSSDPANDAPVGFEARSALVGRGWGSATLRVKYRPDTPGAAPGITTDRVTVKLMRGERELLVDRSFPLAVHWGPPAAELSGAASAKPVSQVAGHSDERARDDKPADTGIPEANAHAGSETNVEYFAASKTAVTVAAPVPASVAAPAHVKPGRAIGTLPDDPIAPGDELRLALSAPTVGERAPWRQRLTLGPGDVLSIGLFGEPTLTSTNVFVGPDGRISFLEAQDVVATGRTIDELRADFDRTLSKYRRAPRTIISPISFRSKKYYVLGAVREKGVFTLDRPLTVVEAVAQAGGLETGFSRRQVVEVADLSRSYLVRRGKRAPVDFEKLFKFGDLSQNTALEPGDYLYFPPGDLREVYVLGEVTNPGPVAFESDLTVLRAIIREGGFTPRAWKRKILVVRGSLKKPEMFEVDAAALLAATAKDFPLQPRDIIYVSRRPWQKAEELLDAAISAFVESAVVTWTGLNVGSVVR